MNTPFSDPIRQQKFSELYNWCKSIGKTSTSAYFTAKSKTLKLYPYSPHEKHITINTEKSQQYTKPGARDVDDTESLLSSTQTVQDMRE